MAFLTDLFARAAGDLGGTTPDVGSNWGTTGEAWLFELNGANQCLVYDVDGNQGIIPNPTAIPDTDDYTVELLGRFVALASAQDQAGFIAQHNGDGWSAQSSTLAGYIVSLSAVDGLSLLKYNGVSTYEPAVIPVAGLVADTQFGLKLVKTGTLLEVFVAVDYASGYPGTPTATFTDNGTQGGTALGAGSIGLRGRNAAGSTNVLIDSINAFTTSEGGGGGDAELPVGTGFGVVDASLIDDTVVVINLLTATDDVGVTGYTITESGTKPASSAGFTAVTPATSYALSGTINYDLVTPRATTLYAYFCDAAGNVSDPIAGIPVESVASGGGSTVIFSNAFNGGFNA